MGWVGGNDKHDEKAQRLVEMERRVEVKTKETDDCLQRSTDQEMALQEAEKWLREKEEREEELEQRLRKADERCRTLEAAVDRLGEENVHLQLQMRTEREGREQFASQAVQRITALEEWLADQETVTDETKRLFGLTERELGVVEEQLAEAEGRLERNQDEINDLQTRLEQRDENLAKQLADRENLLTRTNELHSTLCESFKESNNWRKSLVQKNQRHMDEKKVMLGKLQKVSETLADAAAHVEALEKHLEEHDGKIAAVERDKLDITHKLELATAHKNLYGEIIEDHREKITELEEEKTDLARQLEAATARITSYTQEMEERDGKMTAAEEDKLGTSSKSSSRPQRK